MYSTVLEICLRVHNHRSWNVSYRCFSETDCVPYSSDGTILNRSSIVSL